MVALLAQGAQFSSFEELKFSITNYCKDNFVDVHVERSRTLAAARKSAPVKVNNTNPSLKYYCISYRCIHGGAYVNRGKRVRRSSTYRIDCPFRFYVHVSSDGKYLQVRSFKEEHNHEVTEEIFQQLPIQRRLQENLSAEKEKCKQLRQANKKMSEPQTIPVVAREAVLKKSTPLPIEQVKVKGYDFNDGVDYKALLRSYKTTGFQATSFALAVDEINQMIAKRQQPLQKPFDIEQDVFIERKTNCTIFLGYTSNMASTGVRDTIRFLVQHKMVDCIVTSAGGVEEDLIKCLAPTLLGDFHLAGAKLRADGLNRIGNLLVPNENYCKFEDWIMPVLDELLEEQHSQKKTWSPSTIITRLGEKINNPDSICYWAAINHIPIFSPALTDGSLGDMIYFHSFRTPGLIVDIASDIRRINTIAVKATNSGMIIIGGGVVKHHICNANLMRNGADHVVFINTGNEFDGSDSGARPDEAVSWGKIKTTAHPVKIYADATLVFPLLVGETFATKFHETNS